MSASPEPEISEQTEAASEPLPHGILNALDNTVNEEIQWIIEKLLAEGQQMLVFGAPKVGKSQFALQLAMCVALGEPFLNWQIKKRRKVLYLNFEMGNRYFMLRIAHHYSRLEELRKERGCEESGQEYIRDPYAWHHSEDDVPPGVELFREINEAIKDRLFFSGDLKSLEGDHVPKPETSGEKGKKEDPKKDAETTQERLVQHWQSVIEAVKPDLVIFDTLSKTHSINESDNSEIQQVLMRIRHICSIPVPIGDDVKSEVGENKARKDIAHIIVHHARKMPGEFSKRGGKYINLDSIRGGSAIRAEADLIFGIFAVDNAQTSTHIATNRTISIEARNLPSGEQNVNFEKFYFCHPRQRTPESDKSQNKDLIEFVRLAFIQSGMRGLKIETLETKVRNWLNTPPLGRGFSKEKTKKILQDLIAETESQFEIRVKQGVETQTAEFPHEREGGKTLYWIKDKSPWLDEEPLQAAIEYFKHNPYPISKVRKPKIAKV